MLKGKTAAYAGLIFVIFIWGLSPLVTDYLHNFFSPTIRIAFGTFFCALSMLAISGKNIKLLNKDYLKIALPTGLCLGLADISQKIGLVYNNSPSKYAFLENLSVVVVPILLFFITRKKPSWLTVAASVLCLSSCLILTGVLSGGTDFNLIGDTLCAISGVLYGVNIAITGIHAKRFFVPLYLAIQLFVESVLSLILAVTLNGTGLEELKFTPEIGPILMNLGFVLVSLTLGWLIRTWAMKSVDPTVVAVMMPFSATVTVIASIILGKDDPTTSLFVGAGLGLIAVILSGLGDREPKPKKQTE